MDLDAYAPNLLMTHWCAQRCYHWLPFPCAKGGVDYQQWDEVKKWSQIDWQEFIYAGVGSPCEEWPWREVLQRRVASRRGGAYCDFVPEFPAHIELVPFGCNAYPETLRHISDPPAILLVQGAQELLMCKAVAIVGARKASAFALAETKRLAARLATLGRVIVSGGAIGCDGMAHWGALTSGALPAPTTVVLAGSVDDAYPRANLALFARLRQSSALFLSERLPGATCRPKDFPVRNRIISGLAPIVVVMQAAERSGALVTARIALDQGRDVWVLRHSQHDIRAAGSARLIEEGASAFSCADELVACLATQAKDS